MHPVHALALRRAGLTSAALAATVVAHAVSMGHLALTATAPLTWGIIIAAAALCGARARFVPRHLGHTVGLLAVVQVAMHLVMVGAPWSVGVAGHQHDGVWIDARSAAVHLGAGLLLALLLHRADRWLAAAVAAVRALVRSRPQSRVGWPGEPVAAVAAPRVGRWFRRLAPARGPPCFALIGPHSV